MDKESFVQACKTLVANAQVAEYAKPNNLEFQFKSSDTHSPYLRVERTVHIQPDTHDDTESAALDENPTEEIEDIGSQSVLVEYDVLFSSSYQVPVLYFDIHIEASSWDGKLEFIYQHLVPGSRKGELQSIGVLGGISQAVSHLARKFCFQLNNQNHPALGWPCFFVHPCRTAEAMEALIGNRKVSPQEYLQIWIGLIGSAVGLNLPIELATEQ